MRLTVTLDYDVAALLDEVVCKEQRSKKHIVNEALRHALQEFVGSSPVASDESAANPLIDPQTLVRPIGQSDQQVLSVALAHYFGLCLPPQLYLVRNDD
ncbi:ribbon-helix-helix domain-containing protein [Mycobacteroides salmoniphilum]|uniref:Ribbon-helix-helix protein CopG domain-containing protein n=1 Tax=Mycobacteroides salmoniphilum TaxID=404941 RepID=A0A4R8SGM1_9MYCO|nr:ribbon-helix-helix domain-containing protein [Mycobacteroides salmoniphilum]TDZ95942.1 hypothetical protein CCUG60885_02080 [Mycobacteroides salmoniphilum]TEA05039.1 hypothetical protein CCUG60883_02339 [Mycobacteroides salmoniphilum]